MNTTSKLGAHTHTHSPANPDRSCRQSERIKAPMARNSPPRLERLPASRSLRRALKVVHGREDALEHFAGKAVLGIELDHLPEALCRAFKIQHVLEGASEPAVGVGILRIELDHPQETSGPTESSPAQQTTKLLFYKFEYANKHEAVDRRGGGGAK